MITSEKQITIGCDPEVFLIDLKTNKIISACGKIGGSKENPLKLSTHIHVQEDNVLAEFNITPAVSKSQWRSYVETGLSLVRQQVQDLNLDLAIVSCAELEPDQFDDPKSTSFGCDPDFSIYTNQINSKPNHKNPFLRSAGGHIHIGIPEESKARIKIPDLIRWLDIHVGMWGKQCDPFSKRTELYGQAGCFRPKPYGVEYRTPSNFWLASTERIEEVWDRILTSIKFSAEGPPLRYKIQDKEIQNVINNFTSLEDIHFIWNKLK